MTVPTDPGWIAGGAVPTGTGPQATLLSAYVAAATQARALILDQLTAQWTGLGSWDDAAAALFIDTAGPLLHAGEEHIAGLTRTFLDSSINVSDARALVLDPVKDAARWLSPLKLRGGLSDVELLMRPFATTWWKLGLGVGLTAAVGFGGKRLYDIAATNLQLAKTTAANDMLRDDDRVAGYRRVLNGRYSCARCVLASTQRYHRGDLMPIHPGCDCGIAPIVRGAEEDDPGQIIDEPTVEQLHEIIRADLGDKYVDAGGRGPLDYRRIVVTHEHGEIGPVLAVRGQEFRGPEDLPSAS